MNPLGDFMSKSLFEYKDYRLFIREFIEFQRKTNGKFSLIFYSKKIGSSDSYLKLICSGKRTLNLDKAGALAKVFGLTPAEKSYFLTLVMENQSQDSSSKRYYKNILTENAKNNFAYTQERKMTVIFEDRLLWEIFSLIGVADFEAKPDYIKRKLKLPATEVEIKAALEKLMQIGAVRVDERAEWSAQNIVVPHKFNPAKAYKTALQRSIQYINQSSLDNAHFDSFCLILNEDQYEQILEVLAETKGKIAKIAAPREKQKDRIAYLNLNFFAASK
jgi:uncharacterized protein (TIGR02147 family)